MTAIDDRISELIQEQQAVSSGISTQARAVSLGVLAIVWLLLGGTQASLTAKFTCFTKPLLWIAVICVVALLFDFMQSVTALAEIKLALRDAAKAKKADQVGYDEENNYLRMVSSGAFVLKLATTLGGSLWLLTIILTVLAE